MIYKVTA